MIGLPCNELQGRFLEVRNPVSSFPEAGLISRNIVICRNSGRERNTVEAGHGPYATFPAPVLARCVLVECRHLVNCAIWLNRTRDDMGSEDNWKGSPYDLYITQRER